MLFSDLPGSVGDEMDQRRIMWRMRMSDEKGITMQKPFVRFWRDFRSTFVLHAVAAHFNNGLLPAAILFMLLAVFTGNPYFEHTVLHLIILALCMVPVSFFSGIRDWRTKFYGGRAPIFYRKMWLSCLLFLLVGGAAAIRLDRPGVLYQGGVSPWLYLVCLFSALPVVVLLGHYGGKLAYQGKTTRHSKPS